MKTNNETFTACKDWCKGMDLDQLLDEISVLDEFAGSESELLSGWSAVCNTDGIIAYFAEQADAFRFRLDYINRILNG